MTYYIVLLSALAVAGLGCLMLRRNLLVGQAMIVAGCIGCVGCIAWQIKQTMFSTSARGPDRGQAVVAYYLANQVLRDVGNKEGTILLFFPPANVLDEESVGTYAGTFARVLRGFPNLRVQSLTLETPSKQARKGNIPLAAFQTAATGFPAPVVCVSFASAPPDIASFKPKGQGKAVPFYLFDPWGSTNWMGALKAGQVRAVVVPRPGAPRTGSEVAGEPGAVFSSLYLMATTTNADEVAGKLIAHTD